MIILILTLLFGAAVLAFSLKSLNKAKKNDSSDKVVTILKLVVIFEALVYLLIFGYVFLRTIFM